MSGLPWFPFYVDDFLASPKVRTMTVEEIGVYLLLLCEQHQRGAVEWPCERIAPALLTHEASIEYVLAQCFEETPDGWVNPRLRLVHRDQEERSSKARKAAKARWDKGSDADALRTHSGRNANHNHNHNHNQSQREEEEPSSSLDEVPKNIRAIYGWGDREGTDPLLLKEWPSEPDRRDRCLRIAVSRLRAEGHEYQGRFFRKILSAVVDEQRNGADPSIWED